MTEDSTRTSLGSRLGEIYERSRPIRFVGISGWLEEGQPAQLRLGILIVGTNLPEGFHEPMSIDQWKKRIDSTAEINC